MRIKYLKIGVLLSVCLLLMSNILPSIVYANEVSNIQTIQSELDRIDAKLSQNYLLTEQEIKALVEDSKGSYPNISDERKIELLEMVSSKYAVRASFLDGQGITVDEMSWIIDGIVTGLIGGHIKLGAYAAKYGIGMARSMLSRAAATTAARVGLLTKISGRILQIAVNIANVYGDFAYNTAAAWNAYDKIPNNGRINF
jgi:hypothetical protein